MRFSPRQLIQAGVALSIASVAALLVPLGKNTGTATLERLDDYCIVAPALPYDPTSGLDRFEPRSVPADARCPVCGMYPARFPHWAAQAIYRDGAVQFFDSPVNLHVFLDDVSRYNGAYGKADIAATFVTDVTSGNWVESAGAHYVHGSNALGPMRDGNLPAFTEREAAERFAAERGGVVLSADQITPEILRSLTHPVHHHH